MRYALSAALLVLFVLAWQGVASLESVDDLTLASPVETWDALRDDWSLLLGQRLGHARRGAARPGDRGRGRRRARGRDAPGRPLRDAAYPLLVASQAIPIVVLAPIFVLAFDYGIGPKLAIVALICFFPITVNLLDGLRSVEPELLKLMRSFGASRAAHAALGRAARLAPLPVQRPEGGRHRVRHRRRLRRVGGRGRGPRAGSSCSATPSSRPRACTPGS